MSGLADALRMALDDIHEGAQYGHSPAYRASCARTAETIRAALAAHDAAVSAGGWYQGGDRTCGPSAATCRFIRDDSGIVAYMDGGTRAEAEARGARVVACVNACTGVADPAALVAAARNVIGNVTGYTVTRREVTIPGATWRELLAALGGAA